MKLIVATFFLQFFVTAVPTELHQLRENFQRVHLQESSIAAMLQLSKSPNLSVGTARAYAAAATLCSAKYKLSPYTAYTTFKKGRTLLDAAIASDINNTDARYLRYTIQLKCPAFLGYTSFLKADRKFLLDEMPKLKATDQELFVIIQAFMLQHDAEAAQLLRTFNTSLTEK